MPKYRARLTDAVFDAIDRLQEIADKYGIGLNQLAVAWLLSKPYVTTVILGGSKPEHFEALYGTIELKIEAEDIERIDELSEPWKYGPFHNQAIIEGAPVALNRW
jgi:aryl-alcohol dehydrogenase-like predicted oxidoreductase